MIDWFQLKLKCRLAWTNSSKNQRGYDQVSFVMSYFRDILTVADKQMLTSSPPDPSQALRSAFTNNLKATATDAVMRFKAWLKDKVGN